MSARKLAAFRQLSLNCDSRQLKKQFSIEDSAKNTPTLAWSTANSESIIVGAKKLTRHSSLDKESSILNTKEQPPRLEKKEEEKRNLKIFLAHHNSSQEIDEPRSVMPKIMQPLLPNADFFAKKPHEDAKPREEPLKTRPNTAAVSKRERFQQRTSSIFNATIKESENATSLSVPKLMRSNSAPIKNPMKFTPTKRKIKSGKLHNSSNNKENPSKKELKCLVPLGGSSEVETMVSLLSPSGSASDEEDVEVLEKFNSVKSTASPQKEQVGNSNLSLRKIVKSVSFQQSSIHAVRSFSASFPARRTSMATFVSTSKAPNNKQNNNEEQREERGTKRRLVRSNTDIEPISTQISVEVEPKLPEVETGAAEVNVQAPEIENEDNEKKFMTDKEKQCWDTYCKMTDRGLKVNYDTILRGMLTPTEYRLIRKESVDETEKK